MNEAELKRLYGKLKPLETKTMTVSEPPPRTNRFGSPLKLCVLILLSLVPPSGAFLVSGAIFARVAGWSRSVWGQSRDR